jgi:hypothetical protein
MPSYTAVGGTERAASTGLSAVLLNRGGRYPRRIFFQELEKAGFDYIVSMEGTQERYDLEELSGRFPFVRFILSKENISPGEAVNLAALELSSPLFFVLWNDQKLFNGGGAARIAELFLCGPDSVSEDESCARQLCIVPVIQTSAFENLHTLVSPFYTRGRLGFLPEAPGYEGQLSLYPYDWTGIYDRNRFIRLGGFDGEILSPYWQLMDFGFRAYLWGETIRSTGNVHLIFDGGAGPADSTIDTSYGLFYLKNLAPVFRGDHAHIPLRRFPGYLAKTGWDILGAWNDFAKERRWVEENRNRFKSDARAVTDLWRHDVPDEDAEGRPE